MYLTPSILCSHWHLIGINFLCESASDMQITLVHALFVLLRFRLGVVIYVAYYNSLVSAVLYTLLC